MSSVALCFVFHRRCVVMYLEVCNAANVCRRKPHCLKRTSCLLWQLDNVPYEILRSLAITNLIPGCLRHKMDLLLFRKLTSTETTFFVVWLYFLICVECIIRPNGYDGLSWTRSFSRNIVFLVFLPLLGVIQCNDHCIFSVVKLSNPCILSFDQGLQLMSCASICHDEETPYEDWLLQELPCFESIHVLQFFSSHHLSSQINIKSKIYGLELNLEVTFKGKYPLQRVHAARCARCFCWMHSLVCKKYLCTLRQIQI